MFSFKKADISEIPDIQKIALETWPSAYELIIGRNQVSYMLNLLYNTNALQEQFDKGQNFYFVYQNNEVAGFASFGKLEETVWKLHKLYILPYRQGGGAGKQLLDFVIRKVNSLGALQLILNVNRHNKALSFYQKSGFRIIGDADIDIGNGYFMNDHIMSLSLPDDE